MATIAKRKVNYWGLSLMDGTGRQSRSEHDFRPHDFWQVRVGSFNFSFTAMEQRDACLDYYPNCAESPAVQGGDAGHSHEHSGGS